jgi:signal transduction histidine kinase
MQTSGAARLYTSYWMRRFVGLKDLGNRGAWALVGVMAIVALLGYQQYRWIVRVAKAEAQTNREKLAGSLKGFASDFDTEITRAHLAFAGLAGPSPTEVRQKAEERLQVFRNLSEYSGLIASVDVGEGLPDPFTIDAGPPPVLVVAAGVGPSGEPGAGQYLAVQPLLGTGGQFQVSTGAGMRFGGVPLRIRVVLDQNYIVSLLLPKLLDRHLGLNFQGHYDMLVRSVKTGRIVFQTGGDTNRRWDDSREMFSIRPDCLTGEADRGAVTISSRMTGSLASLLRRPGNCRDTEPGAASLWTLNVRARPSLAEATAFARRQNLSISFGVLLVLAVAVAVLFVSAHRAAELAALHKQFAAGVSHELRTPLSIISSASENLADGVVESTEQVRQYGKMIHSHSEQLAAMIENALWFAREDGKEVLETEEVDVEDLVSTAAGTCGLMLEEAGVALERDIEPGLPPIRGNRTLLLHGLQNLLANIALYGRAGKWARVRAARRGNAVEFTIEDRGAGISPEEVRRVLQPFYRGQGAKQTNAAGLGLGLTLVRRIVEAHEGKIDLQSKRNVGTTVAFVVPIFESDEYRALS